MHIDDTNQPLHNEEMHTIKPTTEGDGQSEEGTSDEQQIKTNRYDDLKKDLEPYMR